jgi:A/G-specific adenine glycosylase
VVEEATARALLDWYDRHKRSMPWRDEVSPYRTWISEIMLQQTQVETVRGYFDKFMTLFPNVEALARAEEVEVLSAWAGLGYYSRARNLHKAARLSVLRHGGLPAQSEHWRELPGIGPYTFGAVRSIAYGEPVALVDGNVVRVIARLRGLAVRRGDPKDEKKVWAVAARTFEENAAARARPGDYNQALMELGARVCTPEAPKCLVCPVRAFCSAFESGEPTKFPLPKVAAKRKAVELAAAWIERDGLVLVCERPRPGLFAGMWAFPSVEGGEAQLVASLGKARVLGVKASVTRTLTHRDVTITLFVVEVSSRVKGRWVAVSELPSVGMPSAFAALLADLPAET